MRYAMFYSLLMLLAATGSAEAYIGPGPGLSMLGSLFTLIAGVAIALLMVLAYPIRLMLKRKKANAQAAGEKPKS